MDNVEFKDNSAKVISAINDTALAWLYEAKASLSGQTADNCMVETGTLKKSFISDSYVDEKELTAFIGSSLEYAIWQEYGTGEYALEHNGRKGWWVYVKGSKGKSTTNGKVYTYQQARIIRDYLKNEKGLDAYITKGTKPKRMMYHAFLQKRSGLVNRAKAMFKGIK